MTDETPVTDPPKDEQHEPPKEESHEPPKEEAHEPPKDSMPDWAKEMKGQMDALAEQVGALTPKPDMPGDGQPVSDESPVKVPWTHKKIFG